jgi:phosphoglycolate phosphatase
MRSSTPSQDTPNAGGSPASHVGLIFDMDGTLLDSRGAVVEAVQEGLAATYRHFWLKVPPLPRERVARAIGLPTPLFYRSAFDPESVPPDIRDRFVGEFEVQATRAEIAALEKGQTALYEGVEETLVELHERGHPLALISNANDPYFATVCRVHGLERFFRETLSLERAARHRIARTKGGIVAHISRTMGRAVVIGDRVHDMEAGRAAGALTVGCLYGFGRPEEFAEADFTIEAFSQILALPLTRPAELENGGCEAATPAG